MTIPYLHNCSHDDDGWCLTCVKNLAAELEEEQRDYNTLVGLLKKRFPQRKDGTLPDWAIEDVIRENEILRAITPYVTHLTGCIGGMWPAACHCGLTKKLEALKKLKK